MNNTNQLREKLRKQIKCAKDVNGQWSAHLVMPDGYEYSMSVPGTARVAKPAAREALLDRVLEAYEEGDRHLVL